jgi:CheY-like chemotaxis protein
MDVQMPKMDGLTATVQIKKWLGEKAPPIVAMTANVFKEDQIKCFEAGMTDFLAKPISRKSISAVLSKYFPAESLETEIDKTMEKINMNLLDEERILFEFSEDFDIFCELVEDYKAGYQQLFDELTHAIEQKNCENVKITAHTIKGVAANFYSKDLVEHAFVLERMGEKSDLNQAQEFFEKLRKSNEAVLTELDRFIQKNSSLIDSEVA